MLICIKFIHARICKVIGWNQIDKITIVHWLIINCTNHAYSSTIQTVCYVYEPKEQKLYLFHIM